MGVQIIILSIQDGSKKQLFFGIIKSIWEKNLLWGKKQLFFGSKVNYGSRKNNKWYGNWTLPQTPDSRFRTAEQDFFIGLRVDNF